MPKYRLLTAELFGDDLTEAAGAEGELVTEEIPHPARDTPNRATPKRSISAFESIFQLLPGKIVGSQIEGPYTLMC
jgi:hypothetical protein